MWFVGFFLLGGGGGGGIGLSFSFFNLSFMKFSTVFFPFFCLFRFPLRFVFVFLFVCLLGVFLPFFFFLQFLLSFFFFLCWVSSSFYFYFLFFYFLVRCFCCCFLCFFFFFFFARKLGRCSSDIFHHGPEPAQQNSIVKTNIHSHIHSHPPIDTHKTNKEQNPQLTKHDDFV